MGVEGGGVRVEIMISMVIFTLSVLKMVGTLQGLHEGGWRVGMKIIINDGYFYSAYPKKL